MLLYLDDKNRIMTVNSTDRTDLKEIKVDENSEFFNFRGWSDARICCYRINYHYPQTGTEEQLAVSGEIMDVPIYSDVAEITMMTPYVPSHLLENIENLTMEEFSVIQKSMIEIQDLKVENTDLKYLLGVMTEETAVLSQRNTETENNLILAEQSITDLDLQLIESEQNITDLELMVLEG